MVSGTFDIFVSLSAAYIDHVVLKFVFPKHPYLTGVHYILEKKKLQMAGFVVLLFLILGCIGFVKYHVLKL